MKNTKITKILLLVLSLSLLLCVAIGFSANAEAAEHEIIAKNVVYGDKTAIVLAVDATLEEVNTRTVKVAYYWEKDGVASWKNATLLDTNVANNLYEGKPAFAAAGVAAKELGSVLYATVYTGDAPAEDAKWISYSAAEYFYARLYKDGFVNKTAADGKDYNRKLMYEAQLQLSANAQIVLDYNADKLVTDYSYIYTTSDAVSFNGAKTVFGYGELNVTATVNSEAEHIGWTLTDANGAETTLDTVALSATGVYKAEPIFGVHECADVDPLDHVCDSCGETVSSCATNDGNHLCDVCGAVVSACADANADGYCDICKLYSFEFNVTNGVNLYSNTSTSASGQILQNSITANDPYSEATANKYGARAFLAADPENSANTVLQVVINNNGKDQASKTEYSVISIAPSDSVEGGKVHVLEFDFNLQYFAKGNTGKNLFQIVAYGADGNLLTQPVASNNSKTEPFSLDRYSSNSNYTSTILIPASVTEAKQNAFAFGYGTGSSETSTMAMFDSCKWYRVRITFDQVNSNVIYDISPDGGNTWYMAYKGDRNTYTGYASTEISALGISFNHYGQGGTVLFDNINYTVVSSIPANNGTLYNDAVEHP